MVLVLIQRLDEFFNESESHMVKVIKSVLFYLFILMINIIILITLTLIASNLYGAKFSAMIFLIFLTGIISTSILYFRTVSEKYLKLREW